MKTLYLIIFIILNALITLVSIMFLHHALSGITYFIVQFILSLSVVLILFFKMRTSSLYIRLNIIHLLLWSCSIPFIFFAIVFIL